MANGQPRRPRNTLAIVFFILGIISIGALVLYAIQPDSFSGLSGKPRHTATVIFARQDSLQTLVSGGVGAGVAILAPFTAGTSIIAGGAIAVLSSSLLCTTGQSMSVLVDANPQALPQISQGLQLPFGINQGTTYWQIQLYDSEGNAVFANPQGDKFTYGCLDFSAQGVTVWKTIDFYAYPGQYTSIIKYSNSAFSFNDPNVATIKGTIEVS